MTIAIAVLWPLATPAAPAPVAVSVSELIAHPSAHYDEHLRVTGVVRLSSFSPGLCELPSLSNGDPYNYRLCIDIADTNRPFAAFDSRMSGAVVTITGYFSHTCPHTDEPKPEERPAKNPDETRVEAVCLDSGGNGYINVGSMTTTGFIAECAARPCRDDEDVTAREIVVPSVEANGIEAFAHAFVAAARSGSDERIEALRFPTLRTESLYWARRSHDFDRFYGAVGRAARTVETPGSGYRLFDVDADQVWPRHLELCFCVGAECASRWRKTLNGHASSLSPSVRCYMISHDQADWWLIY